MTVRHGSLVVLCVACARVRQRNSAANTTLGLGGEVQWIDVPDGKAEDRGLLIDTPERSSGSRDRSTWRPIQSDAKLSAARPGFRRSPRDVIRAAAGRRGDEVVTPPDVSLRYAEVLRKRGVDAQVTVLPGLGHNIMFTQSVFVQIAGLLRSGWR